MSQQVQQRPFVRTKRDEMTFGILPDFVPLDLVGNMKGDCRLYSSTEVHNIMMDMDAGFVGMRRSVIDERGNLRQLILYTLAGKIVDDTVYWAVYQRAAGSEAQLKDGFSFGFGGHVERKDLQPHYAKDEQTGQFAPVEEVPSSFYSTLASGVRELSEEVMFFSDATKARELRPEEQLEILALGFGLMAGLTMHKVELFTPELQTDAMLADTRFILRRDEQNPAAGHLYLLEQGVAIEEVFEQLTGDKPVTETTGANLNSNVVPCGFISDRDTDRVGHVGNTHLAVLAVFRVGDDMDFKVLEEKYSTIGWKTKEELADLLPRCEAWTKLAFEQIDGLEKVLREQCTTELPEPTAAEPVEAAAPAV